MHGCVVDVHVAQFDVRVLLADLDHHLAPQLGAFQHIGFVDGAQLAVALLCGLEGDMTDAADFRLVVDQRVEAFALALVIGAAAAWLAEVDAAGQFADDHDVQPGHDFRLQRRGRHQLRVEDGGAQVGEQFQFRAQAQQAAFRAHGIVQRFPLRAADGAQQHGIGLLAQLQRGVGEGRAGSVEGHASDQRLFGLDLEAVVLLERIQHLEGFRHDFRTNAVARQYCDFVSH